MKALYLTEQGGAEKYVYGDVPEPVIGPDEVLVRVRAVSVNRRDVFEREGSHGLRVTGRQIPGRDLAGEVEEVGSYVAYRNGFKKGDKAVGVGSGTYSEYAKTRMSGIQPMPDWMSFEEAAAIPTVYAAAWRAMVVRAGGIPWGGCPCNGRGQRSGKRGHSDRQICRMSRIDYRWQRGQA